MAEGLATRVADTIAGWKKTPGTVGIRIMMAAGPLVEPDDPGVNRVLAAAAKHPLPVNVLSWKSGTRRHHEGVQIVCAESHVRLQETAL